MTHRLSRCLKQYCTSSRRVGYPRYKDPIIACKPVKYRANVGSRESKCCSLRHIKTAASRECRRNGCSRTALYANTKGITQMCCSRACEDAVYEQPLWPARQTHCRLVGCSEFSMRVGTTSFCSEAHRLEEEYRRGAVRSKMRLLCEPWWISGEPYTRSTTCSSYEPYTCSSTRVSLKGGAEPSFTLRVLDAAHPEYDSLQKQFVSTWQHEKTAHRVVVVSIIKIEMPKEVRQRHQEYKRDVPHPRRRFHGTSCSYACDFYVKASGTACMSSDCCVCNICARGFEIEGCVGRSIAKGLRKLKYGQGLYFSSSSGKANDFTDGTQKTAGDGKARRCMFVADVAAGNAYRTHAKDLPEGFCPPQGYNSVVAEVGPNVNYDQLVVYDKAAALPTHFVVYKC